MIVSQISSQVTLAAIFFEKIRKISGKRFVKYNL